MAGMRDFTLYTRFQSVIKYYQLTAFEVATSKPFENMKCIQLKLASLCYTYLKC